MTQFLQPPPFFFLVLSHSKIKVFLFADETRPSRAPEGHIFSMLEELFRVTPMMQNHIYLIKHDLSFFGCSKVKRSQVVWVGSFFTRRLDNNDLKLVETKWVQRGLENFLVDWSTSCFLLKIHSTKCFIFFKWPFSVERSIPSNKLSLFCKDADWGESSQPRRESLSSPEQGQII